MPPLCCLCDPTDAKSSWQQLLEMMGMLTSQGIAPPGCTSKTQMIHKKWIPKDLEFKKEKILFLFLPELFIPSKEEL